MRTSRSEEALIQNIDRSHAIKQPSWSCPAHGKFKLQSNPLSFPLPHATFQTPSCQYDIVPHPLPQKGVPLLSVHSAMGLEAASLLRTPTADSRDVAAVDKFLSIICQKQRKKGLCWPSSPQPQPSSLACSIPTLCLLQSSSTLRSPVPKRFQSLSPGLFCPP